VYKVIKEEEGMEWNNRDEHKRRNIKKLLA
jgi:hypothetical protein